MNEQMRQTEGLTAESAPDISDAEYAELQKDFAQLQEPTRMEKAGHGLKVKAQEVGREAREGLSWPRLRDTLIQIMNHIGGFYGADPIPPTRDNAEDGKQKPTSKLRE